MNWLESIRIGLKGLAGHKVRTGLSMLGIVFGVASVVAVVAVAEGGKREVARLLEALGATNIRVKAVNFIDETEKRQAVRKRSRGLTLAEARHLGENYPVFVGYAPLKHLNPYGVPVNVRRGERMLSSPAVTGTSPAYMEVMGYELREGRFLTDEDDRLHRRVCVLEEQIMRELWPAGSALGELLHIDNEPYEVVGVLRGKHTGDEKYELAADPADLDERADRLESESEKQLKDLVAEYELNRRIYIPLSCSLTRTTQSKIRSEIDEVIYKTAHVDALPVAKDIIIRFLTAAHGLHDFAIEDRDFRVEVPMDLIRQTQVNQRIFNWVIGASAGISLLVGGIGIMNIMLANITERRREVGIRRAVGAAENDILRQFIVEAIGICVFGGVIGVFLGYGMSAAVSVLAGYQTAVAPWGVAIALLVSVADGVAFGTYPAYKAAKLDPIEALRVD